MAAPTLGYWDIRGNTEPIRLVLYYSGIQFNDKRYPFLKGEDPRSAWMAEKYNLGLPFPNLPYWIEGDLKITQSTAILRHAARKAKLIGSNDVEQAKLESLEQQAIDLRSALTSICYNPQFAQLKPDLVKSIPEKMKPWSEYLGENNYLLGDRITYVDFLLFDVLHIYSVFEPSSLEGFPNLKAYVDRIQKLPAIDTYIKSGKFHESLYCGPQALAFAGKLV